uniref:Uncharacterized protein n=1 Tax=Meloidogyne enterolobii TaxID=390850 RepID=A0A6V7Y1A0_MELEN|nr:unnamed protein product [Meloidogyne enterolobii]
MQIYNCTVVFRIFKDNVKFSQENYLKLARFGINTEYNPKRFHSIIMRLRHKGNKTTAALIFQSGKVVLTGVPSPELANETAWRVVKSIRASNSAAGNFQKIGIYNLLVTNIVGAYKHEQKLAIEQLYKQLRKQNIKSNYDPTIFPALRFKINVEERDGEVSCLCYISGRVILTGIKSIHEMKHVFNNFILPRIKQFPRT